MKSFAFRFRKVFILWGITLVIFIAYAFVAGIRFNAIQAATFSPYVDKSSVLLGEVESDSYKVLFYENDDKYRTVIVENLYPFWKLVGASWANKTEDNIKLVGWSSLHYKGKGITTVPVQCFDEKVAYIEMGKLEDSLKKDIPFGEVVVFAWDKSIRWNDLDAVAYSVNNEPLYKLRYEITNNTVKADELRWFPVD